MSNEELQPWEEEGVVRRDLEPHRAELLRWLSDSGGAFIEWSILPVVPALIALSLGCTAWLLARPDLIRMQRGELDLRGEEETARAGAEGYWVVVSSLKHLGFWGLFGLTILGMMGRTVFGGEAEIVLRPLGFLAGAVFIFVVWQRVLR